MLTRQPLHPGGLVDSQIVDHDLHDAAQQLIEVLGRDVGAQLVLHLGEVLQSPLPPAGQVIAQHGQSDFNHVGHLSVAGAGLGQVPDLLQQHIQLGNVWTKFLDLVGKAQDFGSHEKEEELRSLHNYLILKPIEDHTHRATIIYLLEMFTGEKANPRLLTNQNGVGLWMT